MIGGKSGMGGFDGENISQPIITLSNDTLTDNDLESNEETRLQIMDPKRRRKREPNESGPNENQIAVDTDMTEEGTLMCSDPKNLIMAGSAL